MEPTAYSVKRLAWNGVIILAVILFGLFLWVVVMESSVNKTAAAMKCGNNQAMIIGGLVAFTVDQEGLETWVVPDLKVDPQSNGAHRGRLVTTKLFERLAAEQSIPNGLFHCFVSRSLGPAKNMKPRPSDPASQWGLETGRVIAYAFDWAAPIDPGAGRLLTADRDPLAHNGYTMVAFGDTHVVKMKLLRDSARTAATVVTEGIDGNPITVSTADLSGDDIYTPTGDSGDSLTPGKGDPLRAWVK